MKLPLPLNTKHLHFIRRLNVSSLFCYSHSVNPYLYQPYLAAAAAANPAATLNAAQTAAQAAAQVAALHSLQNPSGAVASSITGPQGTTAAQPGQASSASGTSEFYLFNFCSLMMTCTVYQYLMSHCVVFS